MPFNLPATDLPALEQAIAPKPLIVPPDAKLVDVIDWMGLSCQKPERCSSTLEPIDTPDIALVMDNTQLVGIVTRRNLVCAAVSGQNLADLTVAAVMSAPVITRRLADCPDLLTAWRVLQHHRIRYLPLLDDQAQVVGVVIQDRIAQLLITNLDETRQPEVAAATVEPEQEHPEARVADALDLTHTGYWDLDLGSGNAIWNGSQYHLMGVSSDAEDATYGTWRDRIHPDDLVRTEQALAQAIANHTKCEVEYRVLYPDASIRWIWLRGQGLYDALGRAIRMVGITLDITDRKRAELTLQESEEHLSLALQAAKAGIWEWNAFTNQTIWSVENFRLLGYVPGSCTMTYDNWLRAIHPDDQEWVDQTVKRVFAERTDLHLECRALLPDGTVRWLSNIGKILDDEQGNPKGIIGIQIDISDRKRVEAQYQQANEQVRRSLREKEVLLQEIHHRVKNNLQVISSLLDLQANRITDQQVQASLQDSQNRVNAMALVHEALYHSQDFSRISFAEYIHNLAAFLFSTYNNASNSITLQIAVSPDVTVNLDQAIPCGLILNELVTNALKYGFPAGHSGILAIRFEETSDQQMVLTIANDGDYLPADFNLDSISSMGLTLVLLLTEQLGGTIQLERGTRTVFKIQFPAIDIT